MTTNAPQDMSFVSSLKGKVFRFSHDTPYTTKDGREVLLHAWVSECKKCGAPFEVLTAQRNPDASLQRRFDLVHCEAHRMSFQEVCALGRAARREKRRVASPTGSPPPKGGTPRAVRIGGVQSRLLGALALVGEAPLTDLIASLCAALPEPEVGERDRRTERVKQAVGILLHNGLLVVKDGIATLPCTPPAF